MSVDIDPELVEKLASQIKTQDDLAKLSIFAVSPLTLSAISLSHLYTPELARHAPDFYADL